MPHRTCKYCGKSGFVRRENVVKGERKITAFYCGACNRSWEVADEESQARRNTPKRRDDREPPQS
jgi:hypothetical protein